MVFGQKAVARAEMFLYVCICIMLVFLWVAVLPIFTHWWVQLAWFTIFTERNVAIPLWEMWEVFTLTAHFSWATLFLTWGKGVILAVISYQAGYWTVKVTFELLNF